MSGRANAKIEKGNRNGGEEWRRETTKEFSIT